METIDITEQLAAKHNAAKVELEKDGLVLPTKPIFELPRVPSNLTDKDDDFVMRLFVRLTRYHDYVCVKLVEAEIEENNVETMLEVSRAKILVQGWSGASSDRINVLKARALLDNDVRHYTTIFEERKNKRKLYSVLADAIQRDAALVSREISRRIARNSQEQRHDRYSA